MPQHAHKVGSYSATTWYAIDDDPQNRSSEEEVRAEQSDIAASSDCGHSGHLRDEARL